MLTAEEARKSTNELDYTEIAIVNTIERYIKESVVACKCRAELGDLFDRCDISNKVLNYIKEHGYDMYYDYGCGWVVPW